MSYESSSQKFAQAPLITTFKTMISTIASLRMHVYNNFFLPKLLRGSQKGVATKISCRVKTPIDYVTNRSIKY